MKTFFLKYLHICMWHSQFGRGFVTIIDQFFLVWECFPKSMKSSITFETKNKIVFIKALLTNWVNLPRYIIQYLWKVVEKKGKENEIWIHCSRSITKCNQWVLMFIYPIVHIPTIRNQWLLMFINHMLHYLITRDQWLLMVLPHSACIYNTWPIIVIGFTPFYMSL